MLITSHSRKTKIIIRLLKIKKENERSFAAVMEDINIEKQLEKIFYEQM